MDFLEKLYQRAKKIKKKILLPEGEEKRVLKATESILKKGICLPVLIGDTDKVLKLAKSEGIDLKGAEILNKEELPNLDKYISLYCEIRKHKKLAEDESRKLILENLVYYTALSVRAGEYDGFVAGASITTRDVAKAAIHCVGLSDNTSTVSGAIIAILPDKKFGSNGVFIYADAAIVPDPTAEQLRDIAIAAANTACMLLDDEPRVAMLSYSTKGSGGSGKSIEKVREATRLIIEREPGLLIDGEVQLDCAIVPEIARRKDPNSRIKGRANIFIFPDLDAGNISCKITERLAKAHVIGPILQGLNKPASDLSRGCDWQDIVDATSVVAIMAQQNS